MIKWDRFPFPKAFETKQYAQTITDEDKDTLITYDVYFSISDESGAFFEIDMVCTFTLTMFQQLLRQRRQIQLPTACNQRS